MGKVTVEWVVIPANSHREPGILPHGTRIIKIALGSDQDKILLDSGIVEIDGKQWRALDTRFRYEKEY